MRALRRDVLRELGKELQRVGEFSLRNLFLLTVVVAVACSLIAWWGLLLVLVMLGAAAGAFVAALACPLMGCDQVLDDLRSDVLKCLGLGAYLVGGAWGMVAGVKWLVAVVWGGEATAFVSRGLILFFVLTAGLAAKLLWTDIDRAEAVVITFGTLIGTFAVIALLAGR